MKTTFLFLFSFLMIFHLQADPTRIIVRAKAKDAKFIGNSIGGAYIVIKNKLTGEVLAQGKTDGNTGNTRLIMNAEKGSVRRYTQLAESNTSGFQTTLDLAEPTFVHVDVYAPMNQKQATVPHC